MPKDDCQKLRRCPFCGGEAEVWVSDVTDRAIVYCRDCDAQISIRQNEQEAIEAWNKRVPQTWTSKAFERIGEVNKTIEVAE